MFSVSRPHLQIPPAGGLVAPSAQPGLAFIYAANHGFENAITGKASSSLGGIRLQDGLQGRGYRAISNASIGAAFSSSPLSTSNGAGTGDFTVLVVADPAASATREMLYSCNNGTQEFYFAVNANVGLTATSGAVSPQTNAGGASGVSQSSGADGRLHAWAYRRQSSTGTLYRDGVSVASGAITPNQMWSSTSADYIGGYSGANWGLSRSVRLVAGWNRALTDAELAAYTRSIDAAAKLLWTPRRILVPVSVVSGGGTVSLSGQSASVSSGSLGLTFSVAETGQAVTVSAGTAAPVISIAETGSAVTTSAGTLTGSVSVALVGQAATVSAGTATYSAGNDISLALSGQAVTVSAGAVVPSETYALSGQAATISAGTLSPVTSLALSGQAVTASAGTLTAAADQNVTVSLIGEQVTSYAGALTATGGQAVASTVGGGRSKRRDKPVVVEIDGQDFVVGSEDEAIALLDQAKEEAEQVAKVQIERATKAEKRKPGKVIADARKTLVVPQIKAPGLEEYASQILSDIRDSYASAMRTIEVAALLRKREQAEEDDEEVLMLML